MPSACPTWARLSPACARKSKRVECSPLLGTTVSGSASRTFMALTKFSGVGLATPFSHLEIAPRESLAAIARSVMLMPDFRRSFLKAVGLKSDNDIRGILILHGSNTGRFFFRLNAWEKGSKGEMSGNKDRLQVAAQGNMRYGDGGN